MKAGITANRQQGLVKSEINPSARSRFSNTGDGAAGIGGIVHSEPAESRACEPRHAGGFAGLFLGLTALERVQPGADDGRLRPYRGSAGCAVFERRAAVLAARCRPFGTSPVAVSQKPIRKGVRRDRGSEAQIVGIQVLNAAVRPLAS